MSLPLDVCIRGSGIVGRALALLLARDRLRVGLVRAPEPVVPPAEDVRAYAINAASRDLLVSLRAWPDDSRVTPVLGMQVFGDEGGEVRFGSASAAGAATAAGTGAPLAWIVDVPALLDALEQALRYQPLVEWLDAPRHASLSVISEGKASATRAELGVRFDITPYPQKAIAARIRCEKPHGRVARQWFSPGEILGVLPMGGATDTADGNLQSIVWSVRSERVPALMALEPEAFCAELEQASHHALGRISLDSARVVWPLVQAQADRWCGPGWVLAGDAAHAVHPLAGQGLNLGLGDVVELGRVLHGRELWRGVGDLRLLRRYERTRKTAALAMVSACDGLQLLFGRSHPALAGVRNWGMNGFERAGALKDWVVRQAAGHP